MNGSLCLYFVNEMYIAAHSVYEVRAIVYDETGQDPSTDPDFNPRLIADDELIMIYVDARGGLCNYEKHVDVKAITAAQWLQALKPEDGEGFVLCWEQ